MPVWKIILPLLNQEVLTFEEPVWHLAGEVSCRIIDDVDYGIVWRYLDEVNDEQYRPMITPKTQCICIASVEEPDSTSEKLRNTAGNQATIIQAVLNLFSDGNPVVFAFAVAIALTTNGDMARAVEGIPVVEIFDLEPVSNLHQARSSPYRLKASATQERLNQTYRVMHEVSEKYPQIFVTLSRFNSSLTRTTESDRIIDITVSLESLIRERSELRFKFATYLSFLVESDPKRRQEAFDLFVALYDARSGLVHGTPEDARKALIKVRENWAAISRLTRAAIIYYMSYLFSELCGNVEVSWKEHMKQLFLGIDHRIVD